MKQGACCIKSRYSYLCEQGHQRGFPLLSVHRIIVNRRSKLHAYLDHLFSLSLVLASSYSLVFSLIPVAAGFQWLILAYGLLTLVFQRNAVEQGSGTIVGA